MYRARRRFVRQCAENSCDKRSTWTESECILLYTLAAHIII